MKYLLLVLVILYLCTGCTGRLGSEITTEPDSIVVAQSSAVDAAIAAASDRAPFDYWLVSAEGRLFTLGSYNPADAASAEDRARLSLYKQGVTLEEAGFPGEEELPPAEALSRARDAYASSGYQDSPACTVTHFAAGWEGEGSHPFYLVEFAGENAFSCALDAVTGRERALPSLDAAGWEQDRRQATGQALAKQWAELASQLRLQTGSEEQRTLLHSQLTAVDYLLSELTAAELGQLVPAGEDGWRMELPGGTPAPAAGAHAPYQAGSGQLYGWNMTLPIWYLPNAQPQADTLSMQQAADLARSACAAAGIDTGNLPWTVQLHQAEPNDPLCSESESSLRYTCTLGESWMLTSTRVLLDASSGQLIQLMPGRSAARAAAEQSGTDSQAGREAANAWLTDAARMEQAKRTAEALGLDVVRWSGYAVLCPESGEPAQNPGGFGVLRAELADGSCLVINLLAEPQSVNWLQRTGADSYRPTEADRNSPDFYRYPF